MREFEYTALPWNLIFGVGALARLPEELTKLGFSRALVLSTPEQSDDANRIADLLGSLAVGVFTEAVMHVPVETVQQARKAVKSLNADCTVSIGGGSTTGLGKALKLEDDLPNIAIPTTYAGSEMTNLWGLSEGGRKATGRDAKVVPNLTVYDPELTLSLPARIAGPSGMNALAHAVVNIGLQNPNPIVLLMAEEAIRALSASLPVVLREPHNIDARSEVMYGVMFAGASLGTGLTTLHHKLCHTVGGTFNTPHAETHAIILPHAVAYNASAVPESTQRIATALGVDDAAAGLFDLVVAVGAPTGLKDIGMREADLELATDQLLENPFPNPAPLSRDGVLELLRNAYQGQRPTSS
jgi:maleylacetate reductase